MTVCVRVVGGVHPAAPLPFGEPARAFEEDPVRWSASINERHSEAPQRPKKETIASVMVEIKEELLRTEDPTVATRSLPLSSGIPRENCPGSNSEASQTQKPTGYGGAELPAAVKKKRGVALF